MAEPVLSEWLAWFRTEESRAQARAVAVRLGRPVYGMAGPHAERGILDHHTDPTRPARYLLLRLRYGTNDRFLEVTNGNSPLGGTDGMVREVVRASVFKARPPFTRTVTERLVKVPVDGVSTQFRVIEADTGHWQAAGGIGKRHLLLTGCGGITPEGLALTRVVLP